MDSISNKRYDIKGKVDRFEDTSAVLRLENDATVIWPIKKLPDDAKKGSEIRLIISTAKTDEEEKAHIAKAVLNEILQNGQES